MQPVDRTSSTMIDLGIWNIVPPYSFQSLDIFSGLLTCIEHIFKRILSNMKVGFEDYSHATLPSSEINFRNISNDQLGVLFQMFSEL